MTTILGIRQNGATYLAADTRVCCGNPLPVRQKKLSRHGPWALACSGDARLGNLLEGQELDAKISGGATPLEVTTALRDAIAADGWQKEQGSIGSAVWGKMTILLASADGLWHVGCDLSFSPVSDGCIVGGGSGSEYALGAWAALERANLSPPDALREAIRIAASFDPGTGGPVDVVALGESTAAHQSDRSTVYITLEDLLAPLPADEEAKLRRVRRQGGGWERVPPGEVVEPRSGPWPDYAVARNSMARGSA